MNDFDEILRREPLTQANLDMLARTLRPIEAIVVRLGDADLSKGAGVLSNNRKCIWTKDGHRITFTMISGGGFLSSLSKEVDPAANPDATPAPSGE
ncbi:MAG TPA: hypothetical protein VL866_24490 [Pyrinomonadaceae bacterium]|nr:hypothetical protein [Pyrinomonadaceae bacterium]